MKSPLHFLLISLSILFASADAFAQNTIKLYIGETEKNLVKERNPSLPNHGDGAMVIFRIGQKTIADISKTFSVSLDGTTKDSGELILVSAHVVGDDVESLAISIPILSKPNSRIGSKVAKPWPDKTIEASIPVASDMVRLSTWDQDAVSSAGRKMLASKSNGLIVPRKNPVPDFDRLKRLILNEANASRKSNEMPSADALVVFGIGSKKCGAACDANTEVLTLLLKPGK